MREARDLRRAFSWTLSLSLSLSLPLSLSLFLSLSLSLSEAHNLVQALRSEISQLRGENAQLRINQVLLLLLLIYSRYSS